jgi:hypothetical protein
LLRAIITYFSDHPAPSFEAIAQLDPAGIASEIRARASAATVPPRLTETALATARDEIAGEYEDLIAAAICLLVL